LTEAEEIKQWKQFADKLLPHKGFVLNRNKRITSVYATLYEQNRSIFKWIGMAAFASHRVGLALTPYEIYTNKKGSVKLSTVLELDPLDTMSDIDLIRYTNNKVFRDIAWVHFAYKAKGFEEIERLLKNNNHYKLVLEAFRCIHEGEKLLKINNRKANHLLWKSTFLLIKHEQEYVIQPCFERLSKGFRTFMTLFTAMDFGASNITRDWKSNTSFYIFMWIRGLMLMLKTFSLPDITKVEHRMFWINRRMFAIWKRIDRKDKMLKSKLEILKKLFEPA
jgi:hypothetical protein